MCAEDGVGNNAAVPTGAAAADSSSGAGEDGAGDESEGERVVAGNVARIEDGEPMGPSAADEAAMLADDDMPAVVAPPARPLGALPSLDSLLSRIPPPTRAALDEQLRARFVRVRKLKPGEMR